MGNASENGTWLHAGPLRVRADGSDARIGEAPIDLTPAQRLVLAALVRRTGHLARRADVYAEAFGRELAPGSRAVDIHIGRIRSALGPFAACIVTIGRVGYRIDTQALVDVAH